MASSLGLGGLGFRVGERAPPPWHCHPRRGGLASRRHRGRGLGIRVTVLGLGMRVTRFRFRIQEHTHHP